jgi:hypothetical protein
MPGMLVRCSSGRRCSAPRSNPSMPRATPCPASSRSCRCRAASRWSRRVSGPPSRAATRSRSSGTTPGRKAQLRGHHGRVPALAEQPAVSARKDGDAAGDQARGQKSVGQLRISVSRARAHGAARCGRQAHAEQLRDLGRRSIPDRRSGECRADRRVGSAAGEHSHACMPAAASAGAPTSGSDYIVEAVSIAKAYGADGTPIKLQWTREDDIHGGLYRPMYFPQARGGTERQNGSSPAGGTSSSASRSWPARPFAG